MCLRCTCPCAAGAFIFSCCSQTVACDPQSSESERQASKPDNNPLIQAQLMEIQEAAGEAESIVSLEETTKYFQNLNNLVSEPAGIQRRSPEP